MVAAATERRPSSMAAEAPMTPASGPPVYRLRGSPAATFDGRQVIVTQTDDRDTRTQG